jgi:hypothetical protein
MDEVRDDSAAELNDDGTLDIEFRYHLGDDSVEIPDFRIGSQADIQRHRQSCPLLNAKRTSKDGAFDV